ncbi:FixH family protein [Salipaludibacillus sp. HK11]|uniref:FixH family protein n=1 Tax=Salipaludibacillus sp. HK11 TaxID=3394320 RepID=UPI0039FB8C08
MNKMVIGTIMALLLSACGQAEPENTGPTSVDDINLEPLEADNLFPETVDQGDEIILQTHVTQGDENVDDASEVTFEVWIDGQKSNSEMIEASLPGENGIYEVSFEFNEEEVYMVQPHVTARGSHVMPVGEVVVGDAVLEDEVDDEGNENGGEGHHHEEDDHSAHDDTHLHESLSLDWRTDDIAESDEDVTLSIQVDWEESAWTEGRVRFEIWKHGDELREWIDGDETEAGFYEANHVFNEQGEFHVMVHLEDEEIHEHIQFMIEVE